MFTSIWVLTPLKKESDTIISKVPHILVAYLISSLKSSSSGINVLRKSTLFNKVSHQEPRLGFQQYAFGGR